jgi:hypothetical protein
LSVAALQESETLEPVVAVARRFVGAVGAVPSGLVVSMTRTGLLAPDSRLARLSPVVLDVVKARLAEPVALTIGVTSTVVQVPEA